MQPKIFNFSTTTLSQCQISILLKGLKCNPTTLWNIIHLKRDIHSFTLNLRLTEYFHSADMNEDEINATSSKSLETYPRFVFQETEIRNLFKV